MIEQPIIDARLHWIRLEPPYWGYMIENNSDYMIQMLHLELNYGGPYASTPNSRFNVIYAQGDGVTWVANSPDQAAGYGPTDGFELIVYGDGDAFNIAIQNTRYMLIGWPGGGAHGFVSTPA